LGAINKGMARSLILVIDDEPNILSSVRRALEQEDYRVEVAGSGAIGLGKLADKEFDLVLLDVMMPEMDGLQTLERIRAAHPALVVVMMSGNASIETAVSATKLGAQDFLEKPLSSDKLLLTIENNLSLSVLRKEKAELQAKVDRNFAMLGSSKAMERIFDKISKTAPSNGRVLITGASGGVGSALIQLAKRRGALVIALASEAKHADVRALGPDVGPDAVLPRNPDTLKTALKDAIGHDTVTVVADIAGGDYFPTLIDALARGGRYTISGAIAGPIVTLDLRTLYLRDLTFTGSTVLPPHIFTDLVGYIERGEVKPLLAATYPLAELRTAQTAFIAKQHTGNIVVTP